MPCARLSGGLSGIDALAGPARPALSDARKPEGDQRDGAQPLIDLEAVTLIFGTVLNGGRGTGIQRSPAKPGQLTDWHD